MAASKDEIVRAVMDERRATLSLLRSLDSDAFDTATALPGWRVREVVAHLITTDRAVVTGAVLPHMFGASTDRLERWNEGKVPRWAGRPPQELLVGLEVWGRRFVRVLRTMPRALYRLRLPSAWGPEPVGQMIWIRAYDEWIHRQDIRRALGMADQEVDLAPVAEFLLTQIGYSTIPKVRGEPGTVTVALRDVPLPEWRFDLGSGSAGPAERGTPADATIAAATPAFIMAAAGRDPFDQLIERGALAIDGDEATARRLLAELRIV